MIRVALVIALAAIVLIATGPVLRLLDQQAAKLKRRRRH
jgi:hypothetical protein